MNIISLSETRTLWERWKFNAEKFPDRDAIIHWVAGEEPFRWTFKSLLETAEKFAYQLKKENVKPGEVCAIIIRHNRYFYPLYLAISSIGALPAVLAYPNPRLHPDKFRQGLSGMSQRSGLDWIFTERELENIIKPFVDSEESTIGNLFFPLEWDLEVEHDAKITAQIHASRASIESLDPVLLQHSSGTTGLQKPVVLSHKAILVHVQNLADIMKLSDEDKMINWLPLYHDMGLIAAFHMPLAFGIPSVQIDPFEWVLAPALFLESVSKERGTIAYLPNFAYNLMADKIHDEELEGFSLESLRMLINCSEPVRASSHERFVNKFEQYCFKAASLSAAYGLAETTFAVTQTEPGKAPTVLKVDRQKLAGGIVELTDDVSNIKKCVSSGKLLNGCEIKIVDDNRNLIPVENVGEIAIKSVSMFDGYRNYPEKTAAVVDEEGWYYSGDFGFVYDDELYVIGRKKDIIIVAGKNIYPEDIEDAIGKVDGVIPGRVIAFGEEDDELGTEQVSVVAETKIEDTAELKKLRIAIIRAGMGMDVNIHDVYLVPPRWLIKSSAGKPSRKANKGRIISGKDEKVWGEK
ncbi:MAG: AMP-binding protein [Bacteroidota bacterium]